jgi:two-component system, chemotaxis family, sensor kinase Cph1
MERYRMQDFSDAFRSDRLQESLDSAANQGVRYDRLYRDLIDKGLGLICSHDLQGNLLMINEAAAEALGYAPQEMEGHNYREFIAPSVQERFDSYIARIVRNGTARGYLRLNTRSGREVVWIYRNKLYQNGAKAPIVLGHAQDVTWRIELEQRLRDTNYNYRRLFEEAPVAYHEIDKYGVLVNLNRAECELLGYEKREVLGRYVWELVAPEHAEESRRSVLCKLAGEQPLVPFLREYVRHDGERLLLNIHENLIRSGSGEILGIRSTLLDVTEQHRAAQELLRLNAELDKRVADRTQELNISNDRMREFVYTVSHDLQEPLRSISSFAKLLRDRYSERLDNDGVEFLEYVTSGSVRMSKLIKDLLAYSRVLHDDESQFQEGPLGNIVEVVAEILSTSIHKSGATLTYGELPVIKANANRIIQLFQNLIGNSIKYRSNRPPVIHIEASKDGDDWRISVTDNGIGIQPGDRDRIFGLFKRTPGGVAAGSGIGLAICHAIVERHGGRIWVEPAPAGGSSFIFTLPCLETC